MIDKLKDLNSWINKKDREHTIKEIAGKVKGRKKEFLIGFFGFSGLAIFGYLTNSYGITGFCIASIIWSGIRYLDIRAIEDMGVDTTVKFYCDRRISQHDIKPEEIHEQLEENGNERP